MSSQKVFEAIEFAARAHWGQYRKGTMIPYIVHPINVGRILVEFSCPETIIVAGILHDTVEDTPVTLGEIREKFGEHVASFVAKCSEEDKSDTWEKRKLHTIKSLETASFEVLLLSLADKLDNIRSIRRAQDREGNKVWSRFNRPKENQAWYYSSLVDVFSRRMQSSPGEALAEMFRSEVAQVFGEPSLDSNLA